MSLQKQLGEARMLPFQTFDVSIAGYGNLTDMDFQIMRELSDNWGRIRPVQSRGADESISYRYVPSPCAILPVQSRGADEPMSHRHVPFPGADDFDVDGDEDTERMVTNAEVALASQPED